MDGLLGIVEIMDVQHLMVIISKQEVASLPQHSQIIDASDISVASIYEL
jgi:hypothetical protein